MLNIEASVDLIDKGHNFYQVKMEFPFPGCGCVMSLLTEMYFTLNPQDLVEKVFAEQDLRMRSNAKCPKCGHKWTEKMPFV
jgi:hypothetical protein